jgi:3-methyladenine DNA glycosylase AlkD
LKKTHPYLQQVQKVFKKESNAANAIAMSAYMRNLFPFYGIKTPDRKKIIKDLLNEKLPPASEIITIVEDAWSQPERELHYFAIELLAANHKSWPKEIIALFEKMIITNSWWDSVDSIASNLTSVYFKKFPEQIITVTGRWNQSDNIWLQRSSLLFQLLYKKEMDTALLKKYILHLRNSKEFFIQKAIGWILRQYARTDPKWVKQFVKENELAPLSKKEALKHF